LLPAARDLLLPSCRHRRAVGGGGGQAMLNRVIGRIVLMAAVVVSALLGPD